MLPIDGLSAMLAIGKDFSEARVVIVTRHQDQRTREASLAGGATAIVGRDDLTPLRELAKQAAGRDIDPAGPGDMIPPVTRFKTANHPAIKIPETRGNSLLKHFFRTRGPAYREPGCQADSISKSSNPARNVVSFYVIEGRRVIEDFPQVSGRRQMSDPSFTGAISSTHSS